MFQYVFLQHPGHNRVYYNAAEQMALAELELTCRKLQHPCEDIQCIEWEGIRYLSFHTSNEPSETEWVLLSRMSFIFAAYKVIESDGNKYLLPQALTAPQHIDDKISTLLKYQGKTNERFTRMMVNIAALLAPVNGQQRVRLLDPVAGKGTTLFEALVYGYDAYGVEIEAKPVHEATVFFKKFLQEEHWKYNSEKRQVSGTQKSEAAYMQHFQFAPDKQRFKDKSQHIHLGMVCGDTRKSASYFKKDHFHMLVGDLPYGIVHGNKSTQASRNPSELLEQCVSEWYSVLRKGGVGVLGWNINVASKHKLKGIIEKAGFAVLEDPVFDGFEHRVDRSIVRDIIVFTK